MPVGIVKWFNPKKGYGFVSPEDGSKDAFVHINNPDQLEVGITQALNPVEENIETAKKDRDYYFYKLDGKASERVKTEIERLFAEGTHMNHPQQ